MGKGKNKHKKKKEKKMWGLFGKEAEAKKDVKKSKNSTVSRIWKNGGWTSVRETKPTTGRDDTLLNVVLFKQSTLDEIARICLPEAGGSEFQVHYRGLQLIFSSPTTGNRLAVTIPTVFFNMPQKVTNAAVDFNLDEISEISKMVAPISEALANEYAKAFPIQFFKDGGFELEALETERGSIHRHPGNFGFSATDLDNQVKEPGVIFRNISAKDRIQVDSVMYIPGQSVQLVTTETRVVNVEPVEDGIEGTYETAATISYIWKDRVIKPIDFGEFFRKEEAKEEDAERRYVTDQFQIKKEYPEMKDIFNYFLDNLPEEYSPELVIDPKLITQSYARVTYGKQYGHVNNKKSNNYYAYDDDYDYLAAYNDEYMDYEETDLPASGRTTKKPSNDFSDHYSFKKETEKEDPLTMRPTWRKLQTVNGLKSRGIKTEENPMITGDASESDIIAIVTETKLHGWTDGDIRQFFTQMNYPSDAMETYYKDLAD